MGTTQDFQIVCQERPITVCMGSDPITGDDIAMPITRRNGDPGVVCTPIAFSCKDHGQDAGDLTPTMRAMGHAGSHQNGGGQIAVALPIAFDEAQITSDLNRSHPKAGDPCHPLGHSNACRATVAIPGRHWAVRRIMPIEGEGLQGYPRNHTLVPYRGKPMADGPRYKAIGNGWAMPVFAWVGKRIDAVMRREVA